MGFEKTGDIMIPATGDMPSFSQLDCLGGIDRILDYSAESDRKDLLLLITVFSFLPAFVIKWIIAAAVNHRYFPCPLDRVLRLIEIGIKGVFMTLYYSHPDIQQRIGWDAKIVENQE